LSVIVTTRSIVAACSANQFLRRLAAQTAIEAYLEQHNVRETHFRRVPIRR
jgi:hypothetical protein